MATRATTISAAMQLQGPSTAPLDAAIEYVRSHADRVLPMYLLAMLPHAAVSILLIDAIVGERRLFAAELCLYLAVTMLWRWIWLARLQYDIVQTLQGQTGMAFWRRLPPILAFRLWGNIAVVWGQFLVLVPAFYGLFVGSFATPALLESNDPMASQLRQVLSATHLAGKRLFRVTLAVTAIGGLLIVAVFVTQAALVQSVLPELLGLNTADLAVTTSGWAWRLRVFYFVFCVIDLLWTVASVFLFYDSQSRRMATDLRARLLTLTAEPA